MDYTQDMFIAFRRYSKMVQKEIKNYLKKYNLTAQHANYLIALYNKEGMTLKELNKTVDNDGAATTRIVKKLSECEMTAFDYINSKSYMVKLTDKGKSVSQNLLKNIGSVGNNFMGNVPAK